MSPVVLHILANGNIFNLAALMVSGDNVSMLAERMDSIPALIHDTARLMRTRYDAAARTLGTTRQQWRTLVSIARCAEPPTQAELAELLEVERITLCRMIDRLADAGLVERRADPRDRRVWRIHLLPSAEPVLEKFGVLADGVEHEILATLDTADRATLRSVLERLRASLRKPVDELPIRGVAA